MLRKIIYLISVLALILTAPAAAEEISLSLEEAISIGLRDNRDVLLKEEDLKKAKSKIAEAQAGLFPGFSATGAWTDTRGLYSKDAGVSSAQIGIKQYLYQGGKVTSTIQSNEYGYIASQAILDKAKLETVFNVKKAFYTLLLANEFAGINKGILENATAHLDYFGERFKSGEASESEVLKIRSSLSNVRQAYQSSLSQAEAAQEILKNLLYLEKNVKIKTQGYFNCQPLEVAYDEAFLKAMNARPEIRQYEAEARSAEKNIAAAKADGRPDIYASWDYYSRSHLAAGTTRNNNDYNILGLTVSWPVFDGWLTKAKVDQAIVDLKEARLLNEKTVKDIALEVKNSYLDLKDAISNIKAISDQLNVYQDNLKVLEEKYKTGLASALDLDDARLSYGISLFNQNQAIFDYLIARAKFDKATGGPL